MATEGDAFAELIDSAQMGFTVPVGDVNALEAALFQALDDTETAAGIRENLDSVRPTMTWAAVLRPLMQFCRSPRRAPDLVDRDLAISLGSWGPWESSGFPWRRELQLVRAHFDRGGLSLLLTKVRSRISRR